MSLVVNVWPIKWSSFRLTNTDALRDACAGFDVLIKVDFWEAIGRRLITEVALVDGCTVAHGTLVPRVIPLVTATLEHDRTVSWECAARAGDDGKLAWRDGADLTPPALRERLARAQAQVYGQAPSLDVVAEALSRAEQLLLAGAAERALATLADAWAQRHDERLMSAALRAQAQAPDLFVAVAEHAAEQMTKLEQLMQAHRWHAAHAAYDRLVADLTTAAVAAPAGGWEPHAAAIEAGLAQLSAASAAQTRAAAALEQGQPGVAVDILRALVVGELPRSLALPILRVREQALAMLLERGVGSAEVLRTVRAQRSALERADEIG